MQAYLSHLIADIAAACREEQTFPDSSQESLDEHFEEVEQWLENNPQHSFGYYCGLGKEQFPPANLLTEPQLEELCTALDNMLLTWNLSAEIYSFVPVAKKYSLLVSILDEKVEIPDYGLLTIEFCTTDPPTCPLNEYCSCREIWEKAKSGDNDDGLFGDEENPF